MSISNISTLALKAMIKAMQDELKNRTEDKLTVGTHIVCQNLNLDLNGTVEVNPDEMYTPTTHIPQKAAFALFVRYSGITADRALDALCQAMTEAHNLGKDADDLVAEVADLKKAEKKVKEMLGKLPKEKRDGKVFVNVKVTEHK